MKLQKLKPGSTVYDVGRQKMGNTTMTTVTVWPVQIIEIDEATNSVIASWNGNPRRRYRETEWSKWRLQKPILVKAEFGQRLATRAELAATKRAAN